MMIRSILTALLVLSLTHGNAAAGYVFDYNNRCQMAYQAYLSLRINDGDELIRKEYAANPHNLMATYLADYGDILTLLFRGSNEELKRRLPYQEKRLDLMDLADDNDPWKGLSKAGIYFHWAIIHGWYGDQLKAATTFRKSYLLLKENNRRFPAFGPDDVLLGMEEAAAGTIPDAYKWFASIFGMKGSIRTGVARLDNYLKQNPSPGAPLRNEAVIYQLYLRFYLLSQKEEAWKYLNSGDFPIKGNLFHYFIKANIALNYHKADIAWQTLKEASDLPGYNLIPTLDYEMGNTLFHRLDGACVGYFSRFTASNKTKMYNKDALYKSALAHYLAGNMLKANELRQSIGKYDGNVTDADKQAQRFYKEGKWPDKTLLQARILTDGGYHTQALSKLLLLDPGSLPNVADRIEYAYRLAKAYEETNDFKKAVQYYQQAINTGKDRTEQFAARAALQMALIYEEHGQKKEALQYFRICLGMKDHDFQASIDQQAKAGVNRLTN